MTVLCSASTYMIAGSVNARAGTLPIIGSRSPGNFWPKLLSWLVGFDPLQPDYLSSQFSNIASLA